MSFEQLNLIKPILTALKTEGYSEPTPIQQQAIPIILQHKDLLGCAQTGTGKTAAFAIPVLQLLHQERAANNANRGIKALILTPTRELAIQIGESFTAYGRHTGLKHTVIFGGVNQKSQTDVLGRGVDVLIATPGRLLDLIGQKYISLQHISMFVLDEADRMLDMGFIHDIRKIITLLPARRQSLFFSATMPPEIAKLADTILVKPERVAVTPVSSTVDTIRQELYYVDQKSKKSLLIHLLKDESIVTALVFTRTKHGANKVTSDLVKAGIKAEAIHGNKSQNARQKALSNFKSGATRVLVATDIAARGIDVEELSHVINFELPNIPETYVHRIGRTGRAGLSGVAMSFCNAEERAYLKDIHKLIAQSIPVIEDHPFHSDGKTEVVSERKMERPKSNGSNRFAPRNNNRKKFTRQREARG
ncbi:MAG TPA: DEAD/DEAH box helicase [Bacteroidales bacterium]|nr:DEAD/DEAH box helicase [Bacteroidales bacterium]